MPELDALLAAARDAESAELERLCAGIGDRRALAIVLGNTGVSFDGNRFVCDAPAVPLELARLAVADPDELERTVDELAGVDLDRRVADAFAEIRVRVLADVARPPAHSVLDDDLCCLVAEQISAVRESSEASAAARRAEETFAEWAAVPDKSPEHRERAARLDGEIDRLDGEIARATEDLRAAEDKQRLALHELETVDAAVIGDELRDWELRAEELRAHMAAGKPFRELREWHRWSVTKEEILETIEQLSPSDSEKRSSLKKRLEDAPTVEEMIAAKLADKRNAAARHDKRCRTDAEAPVVAARAELDRLKTARAAAAEARTEARAEARAEVARRREAAASLEAAPGGHRARANAAGKKEVAVAATVAALRDVTADRDAPPPRQRVYRIRAAAACFASAAGALALRAVVLSGAGGLSSVKDFVDARRWVRGAAAAASTGADADLFAENCHAWISAWETWATSFGEDPDVFVRAAAALPEFRRGEN